MERTSRRRGVAAGRLPILAGVLGLVGCGILDEGDTPRNARVVLEGSGAEAVTLVTSNDFLIVSGGDGESREVFLNSADTVSVVPGFDERYALGSGVRFFVNVSSEGGLSQPVTLRVLIDGERRFNGTSDLKDSDLEFLYSFR